jgi:hypothetical protein
MFVPTDRHAVNISNNCKLKCVYKTIVFSLWENFLWHGVVRSQAPGIPLPYIIYIQRLAVSPCSDRRKKASSLGIKFKVVPVLN